MRDPENGMSRAALTCEDDPSAGKEKTPLVKELMGSIATKTIMISRTRSTRSGWGFDAAKGEYRAQIKSTMLISNLATSLRSWWFATPIKVGFKAGFCLVSGLLRHCEAFSS